VTVEGEKLTFTQKTAAAAEEESKVS
jgi:hypothetical protein